MNQYFGVRGSVLTILVLIAGALSGVSHSSTLSQRPKTSAAAAAAASRTTQLDPEIKRIVTEINTANIERTVRRLVSFGTRNSLSAQDNPTRGIGAARDYLYDEFTKLVPASGGRLKIEKQSFVQPVGARIARPTTLTNVVATLRGTTTTTTAATDAAARTYVVSGHYDSMCGSPTNPDCDAPGANDDASGVAAVLEMARVMSKRSFDADVIFMAVAGEEQGLLGAAYFAEQAKQASMNIEAMFTNDIIGNSLGGNGVRDRGSVRVFAEGVPTNETPEDATLRRSIGGENDSPARQLARFIKENGETYVPGMKVQIVYRRDRYGRGGDHIPFLERGIAAVRFSEPNEEYTHQHQNVRTENGKVYGDLPEFVDFAYIADVARVNAASLAMLALAPAQPKSVRIITKRLTNDTDLQWTANSEADLAGYEIVMRETTAPLWDAEPLKVGTVTSYTVSGKSKDNYFFGVRAVDQQGHRSPISFPRPAR